MNKYPYTDFHELNQNFLLEQSADASRALDSAVKLYDEIVPETGPIKSRLNDVEFKADATWAQLVSDERDITQNHDDIEKLNRKFELIENITLTESEILNRTTEPNGNPYDFNSIAILATNLGTSNKSFRISTDVVNELIVGYASSSQVMYIYADVKNGLLNTYWTQLAALSGYSYRYNYIDSSMSIHHKITKIFTAAALPAGANIKIYAIRN